MDEVPGVVAVGDTQSARGTRVVHGSRRARSHDLVAIVLAGRRVIVRILLVVLVKDRVEKVRVEEASCAPDRDAVSSYRLRMSVKRGGSCCVRSEVDVVRDCDGCTLVVRPHEVACC